MIALRIGSCSALLLPSVRLFLFVHYTTFYSAFHMHLSTFCAHLSPSTRGLFGARSLAPFHFNLNSMHYNHGFLNGNTNPLCQRGHFPPCTKLISIPHHPITPPHWLKQPTFSGAAEFFLYFVCMTRPKLMLLYVKCAAGQVGDIQRPWQTQKFCNVLYYFLKIGEDQELLLLFCCAILFISLVFVSLNYCMKCS